MAETCAISSGTPKIMSAAVSSCMVSPLSLSVIRRSAGSGTNGAGTSHGPRGRNVGEFLPASQSVPSPGMSGRNTRSRVVMSLTIM